MLLLYDFPGKSQPSPWCGDYQWHLYLIREGEEIVPLSTIELYFQLSPGYLETEPIMFFIDRIDFLKTFVFADFYSCCGLCWWGEFIQIKLLLNI